MTTGTIEAALDTVKRKYAGSECVVTITVNNASGAATNPSSIAFKWRNQVHRANENSVSLSSTGTGTYTATFTPNTSGVISYRIHTINPTAAYEGNISIADSRFSLQGA